MEYLSFSAAGDRLLTVDFHDGSIRLWHTADGRLHHETKWPEPHTYLFTPDRHCRRLALAFVRPIEQRSPGKPPFGVMVFDIEAGRPVGETEWFHLLPESVEFSPDARLLAVSDAWGHILDAETGQLRRKFRHGGTTTQTRWSPDGQTVLTAGGFNSEIKLWEANTGASLLAPIPMRRSKIAEVDFSADGRFIYATDESPSVQVWDAATAEPITPRWSRHAMPYINNLTARGRLNAVRNRQLCAWELAPTTLPTDSVRDYAELIAGRRLSAAGGLLPIPALELGELERSLRSRHPELFAFTGEAQRQWHRRQFPLRVPEG